MSLVKNLLRSSAIAWILVVGTTTTMVSATPVLSFFTVATGYQEGHTGVATSTTATLVTQFAPGFAYLDYTLNVFQGVKVTQSHLHCGVAGVEGPIVAFLFGPNMAGVNVKRGRLASGRLQNANIINTTDFAKIPGCGVTITNIVSLYNAIKQGLIYVNVHTVAHPAGEVRGQLFE